MLQSSLEISENMNKNGIWLLITKAQLLFFQETCSIVECVKAAFVAIMRHRKEIWKNLVLEKHGWKLQGETGKERDRNTPEKDGKVAGATFEVNKFSCIDN